MTNQEFIVLALSFPGVVEKPHFDRRSFKVEKKRMFTTLQESTCTANIKLTPDEQQVFCGYGPSIYPVPNKWGQQGWTTLELEKLEKNLVQEILSSAYNSVFEK